MNKATPQPRNITVLVKPASADCNLHCSYCFYLETACNRQLANRGIMGQEVMEALIATTMNFACGGTVTYLFQGGEPLLAGLDFFKGFVQQVQEHQKKQLQKQAQSQLQPQIHGQETGKVPIQEADSAPSQACYMVQTNGTLITQEFCQFFAEHNFILGVSLDGPPEIHNQYRKYPAAQDSHQQVMEAIQLLKFYKIPFSVLSVVTRAWAGKEVEIYRWFQSHQLNQLQFIYCIPPDAADTTFCLTNQEYSQLNKTFFRLYWQDLCQGKEISIRFYDNLLAMLQGRMPEQCGMMGYCPATITVEADGSLYPCDFYCSDNWYIGNIKEMGLKELFYHPVMQEFLISSQKREEACTTCPVLGLCRGGCRREREPSLRHEEKNPHSLTLHKHCQGRKDFFTYLLTTVQSGRFEP